MSCAARAPLCIGQKVAAWFEVAVIEDPALLSPDHVYRNRIDQLIGRLAAVGVADAHDLERRIETVATATASTR
ncbi:MAG: hypothetical protein IIZ38_18990 [Sphingomonas sp.]|uniref:hypothetical protein n=1 Tax=Sphingomonas sp. TaxID=28214 RepID=UPI0025FD77F8|nr:hypothetical protein [Sphingomonas sp.]MBQ1500397.1 hypothetical protein [Sphingomonas sp.]MBQ8102660.1 hypothetical protein [Afipia sp.]